MVAIDLAGGDLTKFKLFPLPLNYALVAKTPLMVESARVFAEEMIVEAKKQGKHLAEASLRKGIFLGHSASFARKILPKKVKGFVKNLVS